MICTQRGVEMEILIMAKQILAHSIGEQAVHAICQMNLTFHRMKVTFVSKLGGHEQTDG